MTSYEPIDVTNDLFHNCALRAFVDIAVETQGMPDSEATRRLAYSYYEAELKSAIILDV